MSAPRKKTVLYTTPAGKWMWPHLRRPDDKPIKGKAQRPAYKLSVRYNEDDTNWLTLKAKLDAEVEASFAQAKADNPKKKLIIQRAYPYSVVMDAEGNPTGEVEVKFKQNATFEVKGVTKHAKVSLFDAAGKPLPAGVDPWSGSVGKVSYSIRPYFMESTNSAGISLSLQAVQVIELASAGERSASGFGFGSEDGYVSTEQGEDGDATADSGAQDEDDEVPF